jgi:uncharacterized protein YqhQ
MNNEQRIEQTRAAAEGEAVLERPATGKGEMARVTDETGVVCQTHIGGQALIEGIMMRGKYNWAVAVREPDGNIYVEEHDLVSGKDKNSWMYKPVIRGCTALVESLALGYKALEIAAHHAFGDEEIDAGSSQAVSANGGDGGRTSNGTNTPQEEEKSGQLPKAALTASMIGGLVLGIVIFIVLPAVITNLLVGDYGERTLLWNIVDGVLRVAIFIFYIWLIGRMEDIRRMFGYHGAEHKTIHCYEHGLDLKVANAQRFPTLHVRCGTAFMLTTMLIAIFVFTVVPVDWLIDWLGITNGVARLGVVILSRIVLLPLIAGLSYEVTVKWAGSRPNHPLVKIVLWPGLQLQKLSTNAPDDGMVECAIAAMQCVLAREQLEAAKGGGDAR